MIGIMNQVQGKGEKYAFWGGVIGIFETENNIIFHF